MNKLKDGANLETEKQETPVEKQETPVENQNTPVGSGASRAKILAPGIRIIKGQLRDFEDNSKIPEVVHIEVYDAISGENVSFIANKGQLDAFTSNNMTYAEFLEQNKGGNVYLELQMTIGGQTSYLDKKDNMVKTHNQTGLVLGKMKMLTSMEFQLLMKEAELNMIANHKRNNMQADVVSKKDAMLFAGFSEEQTLTVLAASM